MAKRFNNCKCIHCLEYFAELTSDHVFPASWYPETTPQDKEKWQAPACDECNKKLGEIEEKLLLKFGLSINPFRYESAGITKKVLRSLKSNHGRNKKDKRIREKKRKKILREAIVPTDVPLSSIFPNFGFHYNIQPKDQLALLVPEKGIKTIGEKIIRGITWVFDAQYIEKEYKIDIYFFHENMDNPFLQFLNKFGKLYSIEPGIRITRAMAKEDKICGIYSIEIWSQLKMYGTVTLRNNKKMA